MVIELSEKDLEVIECWAKEWDEGEDNPLPGGVSHSYVYDLIKRLGLPEDTCSTTKAMDAWAEATMKKLQSEPKRIPPIKPDKKEEPLF